MVSKLLQVVFSAPEQEEPPEQADGAAVAIAVAADLAGWRRRECHRLDTSTHCCQN
ncbi:MAG: hypothetical protein MK102_12410 [Fuerstiella sp.]|nr:hypothetical protein [Fuerstiella sp.]